MTSVTSMPKQSNGHFIILSSLSGAAPLVFTYSGSSGSGASAVPGSFTAASWASNATPVTSLAPFKLLKDMGMTVISSGRMFRKVAPVNSGEVTNPFAGGANTFGVTSGGTPEVVLTGFIELGYEGFGNPTPVARYNSL